MRAISTFLITYCVAAVLLILIKIILDGVAMITWQNMLILLLCCLGVENVRILWEARDKKGC